MSVINNNLLLTAAAAGGYQVSRSLRFSSGDSSYLSRTPASAGNRKTWTWSAWVKRSVGSTDDELFSSDSSDGFVIRFVGSTSAIRVYSNSGGGLQLNLITSAVYRDPSAWYHLVVSVDTTQATASDRAKIYVNGTQVTAFSTAAYPSQNTDLLANQAVAHFIGKNAWGVSGLNGYLADIWFLDGIAATPSDFAETDATTGQWSPKAYAGSKPGNSFHLDFSDNSAATAAALGKDSSGNNNNWSPTNFSILTGGPTSVAAASGALPIYNTTGTYGDTKSTGTRTDSNSSSIVLAIPMDGTNNGTTFTDESATIKGSGSAKSITRNGDTKTVTAQSKYYGSSGYFDGTGDYLSIASSSDFAFGTGDFTIEAWLYPTSVSSYRNFWEGGQSNSLRVQIAGGSIEIVINGSAVMNAGSMSANTWQHVAVTRSGSTVRLFINGIQQASITSSANITSTALDIGKTWDNFYYVGYIQDHRTYKGVAKYTSNFNPPSSTQNPAVAKDLDVLVDTPTSFGSDTGAGGEVSGNYCTLNPINNTETVTHYFALSNGNLEATFTDGGNTATITGTIFPDSGKWYAEFTPTTFGAYGYNPIGIVKNVRTNTNFGATPYGYTYNPNGQKGTGNVYTNYGASYTTGDVIGIALDLDNGTLAFYKNGVSQGQAFSGVSGNYSFAYGAFGNCTFTANFGQRQWAYAAPAGFKALCDTNLPAPVIAKPDQVMGVKLWTGNGSTQTISGLGFSPDLVWIKGRNDAYWHELNDAVRGAGKSLFSNATNAEGTINTLTSFNSDGFTVAIGSGGQEGTNASSKTYVGWCFDAGTSTVTNTQGSITSSVRANASAGFSIVTYTGTGSSATVGHGLGIEPHLIITKNRSNGSYGWYTYAKAVGNTKYLILEGTAAATTFNLWQDTTPTSTVFYLSSNAAVTNNGNNYVAYCFAPVAGYSSFGSYTGNGSTDGPFVYTGMRPRFLIYKRTDAADTFGWIMIDSSRDSYNVATKYIGANTSAAEAVTNVVDFLSNGFKLRLPGADGNVSGGTYVYAAFAENPFQYARAR